MAKDTEESKTVPIFNHNGEIMGYTTPEKAAGEQGQRMTDVFGAAPGSVGASNPDREQALGLDFGLPEGQEQDYSWLSDDGRALHNPGWGLGSGGDPNNESNMYWYGDGPRPDDEARDAWAAAHMANAGQGIVPGQENNLGLGTPYPDSPTTPPIELPVDGGGTDPVTGGPYPGAPVDPPLGGPGTGVPVDSNNPTDDWSKIDWDEYVGYEDAPAPDGDGSFDKWHGKNKQRDTSWNWDFFRDKQPGDRQWGGYDTDYQAFERYQPGMDSPWGMPNVKGGNEDFYQQQFVNQLKDEQSFRSRQREGQQRRAQIMREDSKDINPQDMWSWAYGGQGMPEVKMGTGAVEPQSWQINEAFTPGESTNADILNWAQGSGQYDTKIFDTIRDSMTQAGRDSTSWSRFGDQNKFKDAIGGWGGFGEGQQKDWDKFIGSVYNQANSGGPRAPAGYASPIQWGSDYQSYASGTGE